MKNFLFRHIMKSLEEKCPIKYERHVPLLMVTGDMINHQRHKLENPNKNPKESNKNKKTFFPL